MPRCRSRIGKIFHWNAVQWSSFTEPIHVRRAKMKKGVFVYSVLIMTRGSMSLGDAIILRFKESSNADWVWRLRKKIVLLFAFFLSPLLFLFHTFGHRRVFHCQFATNLFIITCPSQVANTSNVFFFLALKIKQMDKSPVAPHGLKLFDFRETALRHLRRQTFSCCLMSTNREKWYDLTFFAYIKYLLSLSRFPYAHVFTSSLILDLKVNNQPNLKSLIQ